MIAFALSPFWTFGLLGIVLLVGIVSLIVVSERQLATGEHDAEREIARLTLKVRHPWRSRWYRLIGVE